MKSYRVEAAEPFKRQLADAQEWWIANRDKNPRALDQDVSRLLKRVENTPWAGQGVAGYPSVVRTMLLRKTHHRVAYRIDDEDGVVTLLVIWGSAERRPPEF